MAYTVKHTELNNQSKPDITVEDQTLDTSTSVTFVGKNYPGYATVIAENFLHLLENFAAPTAPLNPVQGQLWFNNSAGNNQLYVWDSSRWAPTGGVKKQSGPPTLSTPAIKGDLYVDTAGQQVYLYTGSSWVLVGPTFSTGSKTGPQFETIVDLTDTTNNVITFYADGNRVAIISGTAFTPKGTIPGFTLQAGRDYAINPGMNLSSEITNNQFWGTSEKAKSLVINGTAIAASNFLRSDQVSTTTYGINVRSDSGLNIGGDLNFTVSTDGNKAILYNKVSGASIDLRVNNQGNVTTVLRVDSTTNVGINKQGALTAALDVGGSIATDDSLKITGTDDVINFNSASLVAKGGAAITKQLLVGTDATIGGQIILNKDTTGIQTGIDYGTPIILPILAATGKYNIGSATQKFNNIYANNFVGNFSGNFSGSLASGTAAGSADQLTNFVDITIDGDVLTTTPLPFNGTSATGTVTLNTVISPSFITQKTLVGDSNNSDKFLIFRSGAGLLQTTKASIFKNIATVPIGAFMPFGGATAPDGWLLCDGSEVRIADYPGLFAVIGYLYKDVGLLDGYATFALPDMRGRFPLGRDNMDNNLTVFSSQSGGGNNPVSIDAGGGSANRVTDTSADILGTGVGSESASLTTANLPEHKHTLKGTVNGNVGNQYYALRNVTGSPPDSNAISGFGATAPGQGQYLTDSGGVDVPLGTTLATPFNVMNPYLTINYIIYTGVTA
jgi:microcystin-dependent protein